MEKLRTSPRIIIPQSRVRVGGSPSSDDGCKGDLEEKKKGWLSKDAGLAVQCCREKEKRAEPVVYITLNKPPAPRDLKGRLPFRVNT